MNLNIIEYNKLHFKKLSTQAKLFIHRLGGIEKSLNYYIKKGESFTLSKISLATKNELKDYFDNYFNESKIQIAPEFPSFVIDQIDERLINLYKHLKSESTVRTQNALTRLEFGSLKEKSIESWLTFFKKYFFNVYNYLDIPKIGRKSVLEFQEIRDILLDNLERFDEIKYYHISIENDLSSLNSIQEDKTVNLTSVELYKNIKLNCTARTQNVLSKLESSDLSDNSFESWNKFLSTLFLDAYNFLSLPKVGKKSLLELQKIRDELRKNQLNDLTKIDDNSILDSNTDSVLEVYNLFNQDITIDKIIGIKSNSRYPSFDILCYLLILMSKDGRKAKFIKYYFFDNRSLSLQELVEQLECSFERIRQLNNSIEKKIFAEYWPKIGSLKFGDEDIYEESAYYISELDIFNVNIEYNGTRYEPNNRLYKLWFNLLVSRTHVDLIEELKSKVKEYKSFAIDDSSFYIRKDLLLSFEFIDFIEWIDSEIYNFEMSSFEYDLKVLVFRYFSENKLFLDNILVELLTHLVQKIRKSDWVPNTNILEKLKRREWRESIISNCINYLSNYKDMAVTADLLKFNHDSNIEVRREELLSLLNKNKSTFSRIGNGQWRLNSLINDQEIKGSLRDIVYTMLAKSDNPLHISEILANIRLLRPITENSLVTNLKSEENKLFQIFNCSFFGLSSKKYNEYWYNLPRVSGRHLNENIIKIAERYNSKNKLKYFEDKYGYPQIHTKYLLEKKYQIN